MMVKQLLISFVLSLGTNALMGQMGKSPQRTHPDDLIFEDTVGILGFKKQNPIADSLKLGLRNNDIGYNMPVIPLKPAEPMPNLNMVKPGVEYYILNMMGPHHYKLPDTTGFKRNPQYPGEKE